MRNSLRGARWSDADDSEPSPSQDREHQPAYESWEQFCTLSEEHRETALRHLGLSARNVNLKRHFSTATVRELLPQFDVIPGPLSYGLHEPEAPTLPAGRSSGSRAGKEDHTVIPRNKLATEVTIDLSELIRVSTLSASGMTRSFLPRSRVPCSFHIRHCCQKGELCTWSHDVAQLSYPPPELSGKALRQRRKRLLARAKGSELLAATGA